MAGKFARTLECLIMGMKSRFKPFGGRHPRYTKGDVLFESSEPQITAYDILSNAIYEVEVVAGGGPAAMQGVYDDRGYLATGGSGSAFVGVFRIENGLRNITVGKTANNTTPQTSNTQTSNPTDTTKYGSIIEGVVETFGGGAAAVRTTPGAAGETPVLYKEAIETTLSSEGNPGTYGSGGVGSGANFTANGGASVYKGYGAGQGGSTSEYAARRYWINGTDGYVKITYMGME